MVKQRLGDGGGLFWSRDEPPPTVRFEDEDGNPTLGPSPGDGNQTYVAKVTIRIMNAQN